MSSSATQPAGTTLENLQEAFNGESNARVRYLAFAEKADQEGYAPVASLFRAAARAEEIHANNHAKVIRSKGAEPKCVIEIPVVKSTAENLKAAIAGESYERDVMYPAFITVAEADKDAAAVRTFIGAMEAEDEHAKLYAAALDELAKSAAKATYYVCPVCGYTTSKVDFERCPVCKHLGEKFEVVS
jgi:rubrerythrin